MKHRRARPDAAMTVAVRRRPQPGEWVLGRCWLGCGADDAFRPVLWVGHVSLWGPNGGADADLFGCESCLGRIYRMARADQHARDLHQHV